MQEKGNSLYPRLFVVFGFVLLLPIAIIVQIFRIQFVEGENLRQLWSAQALESVPIQAQRGKILDREGRLLVTNSVTYLVAIDPLASQARRDNLNKVPDVLSHFTNRPASHYQQIIRNARPGSRYIILGREFNRAVFDSLSSLNIRGVILEENFRRRYNYGELAAHTLGYVNQELVGVSGLEGYYDAYLRGTDGARQVRKDSRNRSREFVGAPRKMPETGLSLYTTIDAKIQAIVEEELRRGVEHARAQKGTAIVIDPRTGAIVALANYPSFNPNRPGDAPVANRRNTAIGDMIEPGSTFKLVTAVAAVDRKVVDFNEIFETPANGRTLIHGQWMRDHDPLGNMNFRQVIERSSNIATAWIAMRLNPDDYYQYARNLGFGSSTGIDLIGEETGRLHKPFNWSLVSLPWMSVGYEVQVTPIQMAMAYAAFANDGKLMRPYIVDRIEDERGRVVQHYRPQTLRQAINPEVVKTLKPVFQGVVSDSGTARFAAVDGLSIAGKTGTAQKFIDGSYRNRYRASFVGFYPVENPRYVCLVLMDEPRTSIYGGFITGPVFRNIARRIAGIDNEILEREIPAERPAFVEIPHVTGMAVNDAAALLRFRNQRFRTEGRGAVVVSQYPEPGTLAENGTEIRLITNIVDLAENQEAPTVPDVRGLSMRDAVIALNKAGYEVARNGSGTVTSQTPAAGAALQPGRRVQILGAARPMEQILASRGGR